MKTTSLLILIISIALTTACTHTKAVRIEPSARPLQNMPYNVVKTTEGVSSEFYLFWFFPVTKKMDMQRAMDFAIDKESGDNLIEVSLYESYIILPLGLIKNITAEGKVIKYR
jgi:hypothetical protein